MEWENTSGQVHSEELSNNASLNLLPTGQSEITKRSVDVSPSVVSEFGSNARTRTARRALDFLTSSSSHGSLPHSPYLLNSSSPKRDIYGDRFIPVRTSQEIAPNPWPSPLNFVSSEKQNTYNMILRRELLGESFSKCPRTEEPILKHRSPTKHAMDPYSLSPMSHESQKLLASAKPPPRKISKNPFKILEAPDLQDDFYLNLVDWSSQNLLAVALSNAVFLWNATTSHVTELCNLPADEAVTSVNWNDVGDLLAVGTSKGLIQLWDVAQQKKVRTMGGHKHRVSVLAWNGRLLSSGGRDRAIYHRDLRQQQDFTLKLAGHKQEVCGLKWSFDGQFLASGGNDNKLQIWDISNTNPLAKFSDHVAAVKAIAWSPHQRGLLASGGGTADRCIRFWNILNFTPINFIDTGSQVCNLIWSKNINELVSTHGFSQNQIVVWSYPSMTSIATLVGHTMRVLYLSMSPDCQTIITGAGDATLRFWNVFPKVQGRSAFLSQNDLR